MDYKLPWSDPNKPQAAERGHRNAGVDSDLFNTGEAGQPPQQEGTGNLRNMGAPAMDALP